MPRAQRSEADAFGRAVALADGTGEQLGGAHRPPAHLGQRPVLERHREVARQLLATGNAYRCYLTPAELEGMHKAIEAERKAAKEE